MASICFYFQVHQPYRLKNFRYLNLPSDFNYFDEGINKEVIKKVSKKCYLPTNKLLLNLIKHHNSKFRVSFSITGVVLEQLQRYAPEVIESFVELSNTGCVEFLSETYYHSLSSLYNEEEFYKQIERHSLLLDTIFNFKPSVFRNTELIYDDRIAKMISKLGFKGIITEGSDKFLKGKSPNWVYNIPKTNTKLLLKNYHLSDDIAFRFSNTSWAEYPLTPSKFAYFLGSSSSNDQVVNLFMDYETFGEHQWKDTGIFDFLREFPSVILNDLRWSFKTPTEVIDTNSSLCELSVKNTCSWADKDRDLSAWQGNKMQKLALDKIYNMASRVKEINNPFITSIWRKLQISDHFYYMSTKTSEDQEVHSYFSHFDSPYDAFINYMNVLKAFSEKINFNLNN